MSCSVRSTISCITPIPIFMHGALLYIPRAPLPQSRATLASVASLATSLCLGPVYSLLTLSWVISGDFHKFFSGHIGPHPLLRQTGVEVGVFFVTKLLYYDYMLILPARLEGCNVCQ